MAMTPEEYRWFEQRFGELRDAIAGKESKIHKLDLEMTELKVGSVHKCAEEIAKHETESWAHNPYKAGGIIGGLIGAVEGIRKIFGH